MIFNLHEYNVTPDINKREELIIKVENNKIIYNDFNNDDEHIIGEIKKILISYKDDLLHAKDIKCSNYKGGRQKWITINCKEVCNESITLIGNTDNEEMAKLYDRIKNKLIFLLEN